MSSSISSGQTGSGKTYTMVGPQDEDNNVISDLRGIIPRALEYLFSLIEREQAKVGCSLLRMGQQSQAPSRNSPR